MLFFNKMIKSYKKSNIWGQSLCWLFILLLLCIIIHKYRPMKEGFVQREKFILKRNGDLYDDFYTTIYDDLVYSSIKNDFEVGEIIRNTKPTKESILLDIGSGTGHHLNLFNKEGISTIGLETSSSMIKKAKKKYPDLTFKEGDALNSMLFSQNSFTHITALYFTLYYIKNKRLFFQNCFDWLMPGGYLVIHLVNRDQFDPILPSADPLLIISPQKYAKKRITNSLVKFKDFQYKANFNLTKNKNKAVFTETFKDDTTAHVRQNIHTFYMPTQKHILSLAKETGFILLGKIDMVMAQYEYQYLYILQKPE